MFKKIMLASLAAGVLALNAPAALADAPTYRCGFNSVQQDSTTGQSYQGAAYGIVVDPDAEAVSIRCYITVNNTEAASTPTGTGTTVATTQGTISFEAEDNDDVKIWAEVTATHNGVTETYTTPADSTHTQIPPQEVLDIINSVLEQVDPTICPVIGLLAGNYVVASIDPTGDIYVNGGLVYDCPPYEIV